MRRRVLGSLIQTFLLRLGCRFFCMCAVRRRLAGLDILDFSAPFLRGGFGFRRLSEFVLVLFL